MAARPTARSRNAQPPAAAAERKGDQRRQALIDATLACFVEDGWARTNMSLIARRAGVTRGMMQYYFPTLEDALKASVDYLNETWRERYFQAVASHRLEAPGDVFTFGIDQLWRRVREPLHVAKQELDAAARTDEELRAVMQTAALADEAGHVQAGMHAYPELAQADPDAFAAARDFTLVFLEGLSLYRFPSNADVRQQRQLELLKRLLAHYWRSRGISSQMVGGQDDAGEEGPAPQVSARPGPDAAAVAEAASLIARAQALLLGDVGASA